MRPTVLRTALKNGIEWMLNAGYFYVRDSYLPALEQATDARLTARAAYQLGELWQLNDAPRAAMRAYQLCSKHAPESAEAWCEQARTLKTMGRLKEAAAVLRQAIALHPDQQDQMENALFWDDVRFRKGDPTWDAAEALASVDPQGALDLLKGARATIRVRRWRACAYGALGDIDGLVAEWQAIARNRRQPVLIAYADWFYLPQQAWRDARLWQALHALGDRLDDEGIFPVDASLENARGFSEGERAVLTFARRGAEAAGDRAALQAMLAWRPRWKEAREALTGLKESPPGDLSGT